jgi:putative membrane protein
VIAKKSALNLCLAFVVATKHYLREEYSYEYKDLNCLISHLPRFNTPSSNLSLDDQDEQRKARPTRPFTAYDQSTPTNIPIELSFYILSYIRHVSDKNLAPAWITGTMQAGKSKIQFASYQIQLGIK